MMKTRKLFVRALCLLLLAGLLTAGLALPTVAAETTWTVEATSGSTFTISRSGSTADAVTVSYRTVGESAVPGVHFTNKTGTLSFNAGDTSRTVSVTETSLSSLAAADLYTTTGSRSYRLELLAQNGALLREFVTA